MVEGINHQGPNLLPGGGSEISKRLHQNLSIELYQKGYTCELEAPHDLSLLMSKRREGVMLY